MKFSESNTSLGQELQEICDGAGLVQIVRAPTRKNNLLDLVLTSMPDICRTTVLASLSDHRAVLCDVKLKSPETEESTREVWNFRDADWKGLKGALKSQNWEFLRAGSASDGAQELTSVILETAKAFIPKRILREHKSTHPWITSSCEESIKEKNRIEKELQQSTSSGRHEQGEIEVLEEKFKKATERSNEVLGQAYEAYIIKIREEIQTLPNQSKQWCRLNRILLGRSTKRSEIPPLRREDGTWVLKSEDKANLFGETFESKSRLPEKKSSWSPADRGARQPEFPKLLATVTEDILKQINEDKATGPDQLPGRILKRCAEELAGPITLLIERMLHLGEWPDCWRCHWVAPLFKSGSVSNATKYRGVHLTTVLSKTVERVISKSIGSYLEQSGAHGDTQWAFRKGHSCRDLVALATMAWLLDLHAGREIGVYLSDISGAFDRVSAELLLKKLRAAGLNDAAVQFLESYLEGRTSNVIVGNASSRDFPLDDTVFQGTVLGPPLWNVFFEDVSTAVPAGFVEKKFADDLSCFKGFDKEVSNEEVHAELRRCQLAVHEWGKKNQVIFDSLKEYFVILHGNEGEGEDFRFLGTWMDTALRMETNIHKMLSKARPKVQAVLRSRRFYTTKQLIHQYKTHALCLMEVNPGGFYHALDSVLDPLEHLQSRFVRELDLTREEAFLNHNFIPLATRRDIGMLGFIFKSVRGEAHKHIQELFPFAGVAVHPYETKFQSHRHAAQLVEDRPGTHHGLLRRSVFGLTRVWNRLPRDVVNAKTMTAFQKMLTNMVRNSCRRGNLDWAETFSPRPAILKETPHFEKLLF